MRLACATAVVAAFALTVPALAATLAPVGKLDTPSDRTPELSSAPRGMDAPGRIGGLLTDNRQGTSFADNGSHIPALDGVNVPQDLFGSAGAPLPFLWSKTQGRD